MTTRLTIDGHTVDVHTGSRGLTVTVDAQEWLTCPDLVDVDALIDVLRLGRRKVAACVRGQR